MTGNEQFSFSRLCSGSTADFLGGLFDNAIHGTGIFTRNETHKYQTHERMYKYHTWIVHGSHMDPMEYE